MYSWCEALRNADDSQLTISQRFTMTVPCFASKFSVSTSYLTISTRHKVQFSIKVTTVYPANCMDVCTTYNGNPSNNSKTFH